MPTLDEEIGFVPDSEVGFKPSDDLGFVPDAGGDDLGFIPENRDVQTPSLRAEIPALGGMDAGTPGAPDALQRAMPSTKTPEMLAKDQSDARSRIKFEATRDYVEQQYQTIKANYDMARDMASELAPEKLNGLRQDYERKLSQLGITALRETPGIAEAALTPLVNFPKVSKEDMQVLFPYSKVAQLAGAAQRVTVDAASGLTAPAVVAVPFLPPGGQALASGAFGVQMASELPAQAKEVYEAIKSGDAADILESSGKFGVTSIFAGGALKHAVTGSVIGGAKVDALDPVTETAAAQANRSGVPLTAEAVRQVPSDTRPMVADVPANGAGEIATGVIRDETGGQLLRDILPGQPEATVAANAAVPEATLKGEIPNEIQKEKGQQEGLLNQQSTVQGVAVDRIPTAQIATKPDLMQFKRMDDTATGLNEADKLSGQFDSLKAGNLLLWEPENPAAYGLENGQKYIVANGHHRLEFGKQQGVDAFNAQIIRESDGYSAEDARTLGAEINIADGKGTIYDQAKFIRNEAAAHGKNAALERAGSVGARGRKAATIGINATDQLFDSFINEQISPDQAELIAKAAPGDESLQRAGIQLAAKGVQGPELANTLQAIQANSGSSSAVQVDLFGNNDSALNQAQAMAREASRRQKEISEQIAAVQGAAKRPEQAAKLGVNVSNPEEILRTVDALKAERQKWDTWALHPELVAQVRGGTLTAPEVAPAPEAKAPKLRQGENQGDLLSTQTEDFALVGEKGTDLERVQRPKEAAEAADAEAKAKQDKEQAKFIGMGGALHEGEPAKAQVAQLTDSLKSLAESSPGNERQSEAFSLGKQWSSIKDGITETLEGLKSAGQYLKSKLEGKPVFGDFEAAVGNRHLALTDSVINAKKFSKTAEKSVPDKLIQEAISDFIDTGGNEELLKRSLVETKDRYKKGYEAALKLTEDQKGIARNIKNYFESRLEEAQKAGILEDGIEDYLHRYYPQDSPWKRGILAELRSQINTSKPALAKQRVFQYDFEAEKAGLKPEKSFIKRVTAYDLSLNKAIADRQIVKELMNVNMPDGRPMLDISGVGKEIAEEDGGGATLVRPSAKPSSDTPIDNRSDFRPYDAAALRKWKWVGTDKNGNPILLQGDVLVHPAAIGKIRALFERSRVRANPLGRAMLNLSATVKQTILDLSGFHPVQITVHGLEHRSNVPLTEKTAKVTGRAFRPLDELINEPEVRRLVRGGLVIGETTGRELFHEGLSGSSLTKYIPKLGPKLQAYSEWLFSDYIPRLKVETGLHALERNRERFKDLSEDELYRLTADQMNAAFGEQNYAMLGRSATMQDLLRLGLLAPDFLEARARFAGQAATKYGKEQFQALMLGAATLYVTARILNKALDDEWHFEKRNMFSVVWKGRAYSLRTVQGDILHAFSDPWKFIAHRINPTFGRPMLEALTGRDEFGRTRDAWQQVKDFASNIVPISLRGVLNPSEQDLFESVLNSLGITEHRASSAQLIYDLATKYRDTHKMRREPGEFIYDPSKDPFRAIRNAALYRQDTVSDEIKKAVKKGDVTKAQIAKHFRIGQENGERNFSENFVGKLSEEQKFYKSLTDDQKAIYRDAVKERKGIRRVIERALH